MRSAGGPRIFGNGIISSYGETLHSLTAKTEKRPFVAERTAAQAYDIWHFQDVLWVVEDFDQLEQEFTRWAKLHELL